jgi:prolyl-tRNA synthetase
VLDDRNERSGVKFKDADLVGIPVRITLGKKLAEGVVEVFERATGQRQDVTIDSVPSVISRMLGGTK